MISDFLKEMAGVGVDAGVTGSIVGIGVVAAGIISGVGNGVVTGAGVVADGFAFTFGFIQPAVVMKSSIKKMTPIPSIR